MLEATTTSPRATDLDDERLDAYERMPLKVRREVDLLARLEMADAARESFSQFVRGAWPIVEPARAFIPNLASDAIIDHLQAVGDGTIKRLLIAVSPGIGKSTLASVLFPAWIWTRRPAWRAIFASYAHALAVRDSLRTRRLVESEWYRERFALDWTLRHDQNRNDDFENTASGRRVAASVDGAVTGTRANHITVDDSLNAIDAHSKAAIDRANCWYDEALPSRFDDPENATRVVVQQRLREDDLIGHLLERGGYECLVLPTEYEAKRRCVTSIWADPRTEDGQLIAPEIHSAAFVAQMKIDMGSYAFAGQYQQAPAPAEGGMFKRSWWSFYDELPRTFDQVAISVDATFGSETGSRVSILCVGRNKADRFLLDNVTRHMGYKETVDEVRAMRARWPSALRILIEKKANGAAVIEQLQREITGVIAVEPKGGKESRAAAIQPTVEAGNVWLPRHAPWKDDFVHELAVFPNGARDDQVDSLSQVLIDMEGSNAAARAAMLGTFR